MKQKQVETHRRDGRVINRAQTNLDFALGISLFVIAVAFAWLLLPNMFGTFTTDASYGDSIAADRVADRLAEDALATEPGNRELDEDCVAAFFGGLNTSEECGFNTSHPMTEQLGVDAHQSVNVSVEFANGTTMCWNGPSAGGFSDPTCPANGQRLVKGSQPASNTDVSVAQRMVSIDGQQGRIVVRLW